MRIFERRKLAVQPRTVSTLSPSTLLGHSSREDPCAFLRVVPVKKNSFEYLRLSRMLSGRRPGGQGNTFLYPQKKGNRGASLSQTKKSLPPPLLWYQTRLWTPSIFNLVLCSLSFGVVQVQLCTSLPSLISSIWKSSLLTFSKSNLIFCLNILFFFNVISQIGRLFPPTTSFQNSGIFS